MKEYKIGDKVKIKSREWFKNVSGNGYDISRGVTFVLDMISYCGKIITIEDYREPETEKEKKEGLIYYTARNDYAWQAYMFENENEQMEFDFDA
jgi:hypothetical protein